MTLQPQQPVVSSWAAGLSCGSLTHAPPPWFGNSPTTVPPFRLLTLVLQTLAEREVLLAQSEQTTRQQAEQLEDRKRQTHALVTQQQAQDAPQVCQDFQHFFYFFCIFLRQGILSFHCGPSGCHSWRFTIVVNKGQQGAGIGQAMGSDWRWVAYCLHASGCTHAICF